MGQSVEERLILACSAKQNIRIIYHGGSQPGTVREVFPREVSGNLLTAREVGTKTSKTFDVDHIEIVEGQTDAPAYVQPKPLDLKIEATVGLTLVAMQAQLDATGLHVEILDHCVSLHERYKNGKPRNKPVLAISYDPTVEVFVRGEDGVERLVERPAKMKYKVTGKTFAVRRFGLQEKAVGAFLKHADALTDAAD